MKKIFFLFLLIGIFSFAQKMPDISGVWLNKNHFYKGTLFMDKGENLPLQLKITESKQDEKNGNKFWVSGFSTVETHTVNFKGWIEVKNFKNSKKNMIVFGKYRLDETKGDEHTGIFTGKFELNLDFDEDDFRTQKPMEQYILSFNGDWKNYIKTYHFKTLWKNK